MTLRSAFDSPRVWNARP